MSIEFCSMVRPKYILASADSTARMTVEAGTNKGKADIRITDRISEWSDASASSVRAKVDEIILAGITEADLYINTTGGDVFQANEIINELKKFKKLHITVGALAASAATRILAEFNENTTAFPNSQFMIHKPKGWFDGNEDEIESQLRMLKNTTADYKTAYSLCSAKTEDEIESLWNKGDYWMTAEQALEFGLIKNIKPVKQKLQAEDVALLEACGAPTVPKIKNEFNNQEMDKDKLKSLLGLAADATDEQVEAAVKANKEKAETVTAALAQAEAQKETNIQTMVDAAIADKKITADQKEIYVGLAKADFEGTQKAIAAMPGVERVSDLINGNASGLPGTPEAHKNWTLEDYLEKDPEAYEQLKAEKPQVAAELERAYFKK